MTKFPTTDEAMEIHRMLIERFGGTAGIRDVGMLESALHRPQSGYYRDLVEMSAALMHALLLNHACVDGNKRLAFFLTDVFLRMNGHKLKVGARNAHNFIVGYLQGSSRSLESIRHWIKTQIVKT